MEPEARAVWKRTLVTSTPGLLLVLLLYASQVFAVIDSDFTLPVTLLQVPFVLAFLGFIVAIAYHRAKERVASE